MAKPAYVMHSMRVRNVIIKAFRYMDLISDFIEEPYLQLTVGCVSSSEIIALSGFKVCLSKD